VEKIRFLIEYAVDIEHKLMSLPKAIVEMIRKGIEKKLMVDSVAYGKPLKYSLKGHRRLRVGDYRIIYRIIEAKVVVFIIEIEHRKDAYKEKSEK
jgi:mRNA interferase RelE/StbE